MRVAVLSDVHSNAYALATVLDDAERAGAEQIWFAGDAYGYHPWATDTYSLLAPAAELAVLGNHDSWLIGKQSAPADFAGTTAMYNAAQLRNERPEALSWLRSLPALVTQEIEGWTVTITHGTPASPLLGRYYPDDGESHEWLPRAGEILVLGQTHHPLLRGSAEDGLLLNPGSVGQPRDADPRPSWALLDLATGRAQLRRSNYDVEAMVERLRAIGWDEHVIAALERPRGTPEPATRTSPGPAASGPPASAASAERHLVTLAGPEPHGPR